MNNFSLTTGPSLVTSGLSPQEADVFAAIHAAIVEQRLLPGTRLTEEDLAEIYAVSRTRIRRVLFALAHTGMVLLIPAKGAQVARPTADEARAVFSARRLIEVGLLQTPDKAPTVSEQRALESLVQREAAAAQAGERVAMIQLSGAFHESLAQAYGNPVITELVAGLVRRSSLIIALFQQSAPACCRSDEHAQLLQALAAMDMVTAGALMRRHLDSIETGLDLDRMPGRQDLRSLLADENSAAAGRSAPRTQVPGRLPRSKRASG